MSAARWEIPGLDEDDQTSSGRPIPRVVSLHFVRSALRRRWLVCMLSAVLGLLMAAAFLVAFPTAHQAKASLVLTHDPQVEPTRAMATDVSLLRTRTVAAKTVAKLGLAMAPEDFLKSVVAVPVSSELLTLTLTAPSDAEAVRRLSALTSTYLEFRGEQLSLQSNVLVSGMQQRIQKLGTEVAALSRRIEQLSAAGSSSASKLSDTISQRAYVQSRIETLQQSVEDATLQTTALVSSSRVIDPAAVEKGGVKRRIALTLASGLIGGAALGCGTVLFFAITSDRLRRRSDIAAALEVPVPVSVGRIAPLPEQWLWLPHMRALEGRRTDGRQRLARVIEMELPAPRQSGRLAVICIDNADEVQFAVAAAASELAAAGRSVALVDLTKEGSLDGGTRSSDTSSIQRPSLFRPRGIPALASSAVDLRPVGHEAGSPPPLESTAVTLVLADLDPSVGVEYLTPWTSRVVIVVTAGRSSAELVRTAADLVRVAGLESRVAALLHTERTDDSSGTAGFDRSVAAHLLAQYHPAESTSGPADEEQVRAEEQQATSVEEQQTAEAEPIDNGQPTAEDRAAAEASAVGDERPTLEMAIVEAHRSIEEQTAGEEQPADGGLAADQEQGLAAALQERPTAQEQTTVEEQQADQQATPQGPPATATQEQEAEEQQSADEQHAEATSAAEALRNARQRRQRRHQSRRHRRGRRGDDPHVDPMSTIVNPEEQPADEETVADHQGIAVEQETSAAELVPDGPEGVAETDQVADLPLGRRNASGLRIYRREDPLVHVGPSPSSGNGESDRSWDLGLDNPDHEHASAGTHADNQTGLIAEPDEIPSAAWYEMAGDRWNLYVEAYPPKHADSHANAEDDTLELDLALVVESWKP